MSGLIWSRTSVVWLVLTGATLASWIAGHGAFSDLRYAQVAIIGVAFFKVRCVLHEFMELRHAPMPMRIVADVWVVVVCLALLGIYLGVIPAA